MYRRASTIGKQSRGWSLEFINRVRRWSIGAQQTLIPVIQHEAVVQCVIVGVGDLNGSHPRFIFAILWHQNPPLLIDASFAVARNAPLVHQRDRAAVGQGLDPFGL